MANAQGNKEVKGLKNREEGIEKQNNQKEEDKFGNKDPWKVKRKFEMIEIMAQRAVAEDDVERCTNCQYLIFLRRELLVIINGSYGEREKWMRQFHSNIQLSRSVHMGEVAKEV